ncbi:MAG: HigA family addiction module antitoxin [Candidatus Thermoplasmatota archaeon]|nr:HigA family addiction module antitoxin [Candidatus Thermoplasmatota archaeon]
MANKKGRLAIAPGEYIREELEARGWTQEDLARIIGRSQPKVNEIVTGKRAITTQTARELAGAFDTSAQLWMNLESAYQLAKSEEPIGEIEERAKLYSKAPVKEMERRGWIKKTETTHELEAELCRFYETPSLDLDLKLTTAARQSVNDDVLDVRQIAWCYRAYHLAPAIEAAPYTAAKLRSALAELRIFAAQPEYAQEVHKRLTEAGVRLIVVEHLPRTRIDGAALWRGNAPVIVLSMRYDRIDWFWHTLQHEISHILNRDYKDLSLDVDLQQSDRSAWSLNPDIERRADADAAAALIDPSEMELFIRRRKPYYSKKWINRFANRIKIHPGIIVGQLQHRGEIGWYANREMLAPVREHVVGYAMTDGFGHRPEVK